MKCKRLNEVIELLQPAWQKEPELNLMQFLQKLAKEAGYTGELKLLFPGFRKIMKKILKPRCYALAA